MQPKKLRKSSMKKNLKQSITADILAALRGRDCTLVPSPQACWSSCVSQVTPVHTADHDDMDVGVGPVHTADDMDITPPCDDITVPTKCDLLVRNVDSDGPKLAAWGLVFPRGNNKEDEMLHTYPMCKIFARVSVDDVHEGFSDFALPVPPNDEMTTLLAAKGSFIQWPKMDILLQKTNVNPVLALVSPTTITPKIKEAPALEADKDTEDIMSTPLSVAAKIRRDPIAPQAPPSRRYKRHHHQLLQRKLPPEDTRDTTTTCCSTSTSSPPEDKRDTTSSCWSTNTSSPPEDKRDTTTCCSSERSYSCCCGYSSYPSCCGQTYC